MQMARLMNAVRLQAMQTQNARATVKLGTISSYSPDGFSAKVKYEPYVEEGENQASESGFLPLASIWVGNQWGLVAAPPIGAQCIVLPIEGSWDTGVIIGSLYSLVDKPLSVPSGEFWLVHESGSAIKLTNDGKLTLNGNVEIDLTAPTINITTTADVNVQANSINLMAENEINLTAPNINIGSAGGTPVTLVKSDSTDTIALKAD